MIRKIIFIACGALILMSSKCVQTKVIIQDSPVIIITNAYTQKMVSGEQNQKAFIEFGFEIKRLKNNLTLDSVFCEVGKSIGTKSDGKNRLKLIVESQLIDKLEYNEAIFYYSQKDLKYQLVLNNIIKKETLFLP